MPTSTASPVVCDRDVVLTNPATGHELTVTATVLSVEHKEENGIFGPMVGLEAHLHVWLPGDTRPLSYFLSRLVDEPSWIQDAHFGPNGVPIFSNGFGARYLRTRGIHRALEALLDEAARALGLTVEIGPDIPLVLSTTDPADAENPTPAPDDLTGATVAPGTHHPVPRLLPEPSGEPR